MNYQTKIKQSNNPLLKKILGIALEKKSNIALSADVYHKNELLELADGVGEHICLLKTHIDILNDFDDDLIHQLKKIAAKRNFLILEDRKFADIGSTTSSQFSSGIYKINTWADLVTAHGFVGKGLLEGINKCRNENQGILLLAQMSCDTPFFTDQYAKSMGIIADEINQKCPNLIAGFIAQNPNFLSKQQLKEYLIATPGVNLEIKNDDLGQNYKSPENLIQTGSDVLIVGRGIYGDKNPIEKAKEYQEKSWEAYISNVS